MREYAYVSDAKLDVVYGQIPERRMSRLAAELGVDPATLAGAGAGSDARRAKLDLVERHLEYDHDVGGAADPSPWFRGELDLLIDEFGDPDDGLLVMAGVEPGAALVLGGSAGHLRGEHPEPGLALVRHSVLPFLLETVGRNRAERTERFRAAMQGAARVAQRDVDAVRDLADGVQGDRVPCEFLAHRLAGGMSTDESGRQVAVVVGTPLYVARTG